jgi:bifunctional non-homologous end joining protein LigD
MPAVTAAPRTRRSGRKDSESAQLILPAFRVPQLAKLERNVPSGDSWLFEMKFDGYRAQAAIAGDQVRIYSRGGHDWTRQFGYVVPALSQLTKGTALIDGEMCAIDEPGRTNFTLLKNSLDGRKPVVFYAFDLLELNGEDIAALPQLERKHRLEALLHKLPDDAPVAYSDHLVGDGAAVFKAMLEGGHEGVIAKSPTARYYSGDRSTAWLKIKCIKRQEFVIIGWRPPDYGVDNVRGLFLATYETGKLVYRGGVGTGFTDRMRSDVWELLQTIRTDKPPSIIGMPRVEMRAARWVAPKLLAEVEFTEITPDGLIRHPSFKGLREDKDPREVHLEEADDV